MDTKNYISIMNPKIIQKSIQENRNHKDASIARIQHFQVHQSINKVDAHPYATNFKQQFGPKTDNYSLNTAQTRLKRHNNPVYSTFDYTQNPAIVNQKLPVDHFMRGGANSRLLIEAELLEMNQGKPGFVATGQIPGEYLKFINK